MDEENENSVTRNNPITSGIYAIASTIFSPVMNFIRKLTSVFSYVNRNTLRSKLGWWIPFLRKKETIQCKFLLAQERVKRQVIAQDTISWQKNRSVCEPHQELLLHEERLGLVAGVDISYVKDGQKACAALVICRMPDLKVVYENFLIREIMAPYKAGFLSYREVSPILDLLHFLFRDAHHLKPQVILVDGNGLLHPREAGLACHLGVITNIPCVGVAKNLFRMESIKPLNEARHCETPLVTTDGRILGMAVKTGENTTKPVYVSVGHKISLETSVWLVKRCSIYRVPEPIRQADIRSRDFLNKRHPNTRICSRPVDLDFED